MELETFRSRVIAFEFDSNCLIIMFHNFALSTIRFIQIRYRICLERIIIILSKQIRYLIL